MRAILLAVAVNGMIAMAQSYAREGVTQILPDRVSIFQVPMRCPAAPQIGCGSFAKPFLVELKENPIVREAWLNRAGTLLAVVSVENSSREDRAEAVLSVLRKENVSAKELQGADYERALDDFRSRTGWYQGSDVDQLSREEAGIIAKRMIRRVKAKVFLPEEKAAKLEAALADAFKREFISEASKAVKTPRVQRERDFLKASSAYLDDKAVEALREALQQGYRPIPSDKEAAVTN